MLEAIIEKHEKSFEEVCYHASQLAAGDHVRSGDVVVDKIEQVQQMWSELKWQAENRQIELQQAMVAQEVHTFFILMERCGYCFVYIHFFSWECVSYVYVRTETQTKT